MPITVADAKQHLRIAADDATDDGYIGLLISTAENVIERETLIVTRKRAAEVFLFSCFDTELVLARGPVDEATLALKYFGPDGVEVTLDAGDYRVVTDRLVTRLLPPIGGNWPPHKSVAAGISVIADVGYVGATADEPAACADALKHAARLLVGHWYANREAVSVGRVPTEMPYAVEMLLQNERLRIAPVA